MINVIINVTALSIKLVKKFQAAISELYVLAVLGLTPSVGGTLHTEKVKIHAFPRSARVENDWRTSYWIRSTALATDGITTEM